MKRFIHWATEDGDKGLELYLGETDQGWDGTLTDRVGNIVRKLKVGTREIGGGPEKQDNETTDAIFYAVRDNRTGEVHMLDTVLTMAKRNGHHFTVCYGAPNLPGQDFHLLRLKEEKTP